MTPTDSSSSVLTLAEGYSKAARQHLDRLREGEEKIRTDGDLEGVHLMRTSCRRLRATVKYLGDHLSRDDRRMLKQGLKEFMAALGPVRDLDVLRGAIGSVESLDPREAEALREEVEERLAIAAQRMEGALDGKEYADLRAQLEGSLQTATADVLVTLEGPIRIGSAITDVLRSKPGDWAAASDESLHTLRKSVKKLRYALEAFAPAYGRPVSRQIDRCRDLQEALGNLQDAAVFGSCLKGIRTFAAGQFIATIRGRADARLQQLPELWEKCLGPKLLSRLGGHLFRRATRRLKRGGPRVRQQEAG